MRHCVSRVGKKNTYIANRHWVIIFQGDESLLPEGEEGEEEEEDLLYPIEGKPVLDKEDSPFPEEER